VAAAAFLLTACASRRCGGGAAADAGEPDGGHAQRARCLRDDLTERPYPKSRLASDVDPRATGHGLDAFNDLCGDVWCEGSFEILFQDLACSSKAKRCDLDLRFYTSVAVPPAGDITKVEAHGPGWRGYVVGQAEVDRCSPPCMAGDSLVKPPCGVFDLRCEIDPPSDPPRAVQNYEPFAMDSGWYSRVSACIHGLEDGIRAIVPEFKPRPKK
jgi:hypothetical protein